MTKIASIFLSSLLVSMFVVAGHAIAVGERSLAFEPAHQSLVVKVKKDKKDDDDDDDDKPKKSKGKAIPKTCGKKVNCEAGFVKLEKPNKYGACCEAREGLPPPKQQEAEKCKFPGEVGTPPNCTCPPGTEFMGYKGCVTAQKVCCEGKYPDGTSTGRDCGAPEAAVRKITESARKIANPEMVPKVTCAPAN